MYDNGRMNPPPVVAFLTRTLVVIAAVPAIACSSTPVTGPADPAAVTALRTTTSFGFCLGYCRATLEVTAGGMTLVEDSPRGDVPPVRRTAAISDSEWRQLTALVNRGVFEALPATVGCPDCADGGAESLEVVSSDWQDAVTFEYGAVMPPLQPLLESMRTLRGRFPATTTPR
jgi:hypothetical protein